MKPGHAAGIAILRLYRKVLVVMAAMIAATAVLYGGAILCARVAQRLIEGPDGPVMFPIDVQAVAVIAGAMAMIALAAMPAALYVLGLTLGFNGTPDERPRKASE